jgi:hypothetical protein
MIVGPDCGRFAGVVVHGLQRAEEESSLLASTGIVQALGERITEVGLAGDHVYRHHFGVTALVDMHVGRDLIPNIVDAVDTELVTNFRHVNLTCVVGNAMLLR